MSDARVPIIVFATSERDAVTTDRYLEQLHRPIAFNFPAAVAAGVNFVSDHAA